MTRLTTMALPLILAACGSGSGDNSPAMADDAVPDLPLGFRLVESYSFPLDSDCSSSMAQISNALGFLPEETYPKNGASYDPVTQESEQIWYYWTAGEGIDWVWGGIVEGCRGTLFSFTPIM